MKSDVDQVRYYRRRTVSGQMEKKCDVVNLYQNLWVRIKQIVNNTPMPIILLNEIGSCRATEGVIGHADITSIANLLGEGKALNISAIGRL